MGRVAVVVCASTFGTAAVFEQTQDVAAFFLQEAAEPDAANAVVEVFDAQAKDVEIGGFGLKGVVGAEVVEMPREVVVGGTASGGNEGEQVGGEGAFEQGLVAGELKEHVEHTRWGVEVVFAFAGEGGGTGEVELQGGAVEAREGAACALGLVG